LATTFLDPGQYSLCSSPAVVICKTSLTTTVARAAKLEVSWRLKWSHYLINRTQRSKKEEKQHHETKQTNL
jgi:hypothetical protein